MLPNLAGRQKTAPLRPGAMCVGTNGVTRTCDFPLVSESFVHLPQIGGRRAWMHHHGHGDDLPNRCRKRPQRDRADHDVSDQAGSPKVCSSSPTTSPT
jgi:hypothetical protein